MLKTTPMVLKEGFGLMSSTRMTVCMTVVIVAAGTFATGLAVSDPATTGGSECSSDLQCNLNGLCVNSHCVCDAAWAASDCSVLALLPLSSTAEAGLNLTNETTGERISTWGGPVMQAIGDTTKWHMHAALMDKGCGLTSWMSNSLVVHAIADAPSGPYRFAGVALLPWSHNPGTAVVQADGTYLMFHVGAGDGLGHEVTCTATGCCKNGRSPCGLRHGCNSTPPHSFAGRATKATTKRQSSLGTCDSENCRDGRCWFGDCGGKFANVSFHVAKDPAGPWTAFTAPVSGGNFGSMTTPSPWMYVDPVTGKQNGTIFLVSGGLWRAESWKGPYYRPAGLSVSCHGEDPYVYQDHRGNWHCLSHNSGSAGFGNLTIAGGHAFSKDLITWHTTANAVYSGAYVEREGNDKTLAIGKRERPRLIFDPVTREITHLVTAVVEGSASPFCTGKDITPEGQVKCWFASNNNPWPGYHDPSFTLVQAVKTSHKQTEIVAI